MMSVRLFSRVRIGCPTAGVISFGYHRLKGAMRRMATLKSLRAAWMILFVSPALAGGVLRMRPCTDDDGESENSRSIEVASQQHTKPTVPGEPVCV